MVSARKGEDDAKTLAYLRDVFAASSERVSPQKRDALAQLRDQLASRSPSTVDYPSLAAWRLLASNSLSLKDTPARRGWDLANQALSTTLSRGDLPTFQLAATFHHALGCGSSAVRTTRIYTADEQYVSPEVLPEGLALLDASLAATGDALDRAFRAYVGLVTLHPFGNGNGRTARLLADYCLLGGEWLPLCFASSVSSHVARTQGGASRSMQGSMDVFFRGLENGYKAVLGLIPRTGE